MCYNKLFINETLRWDVVQIQRLDACMNSIF
jgi:hypothetical protein